MPVQFLSQADHDRLNLFPEEISREELNSFFWFSSIDHQAIDSIRGDYNRLGFALQLGCLRYLGFFPENLLQIPQVVVHYVAQQLEVMPELLTFYGKRTSTQRKHQRQIQKLAGYRRATTADILELEEWLLQRALEHDKPTLLFTMVCEFLKQNKIIRIGTTRIAQKVSKSRQQAQIVCYQSLQPLLTKECCSFLDKLLKIDEKLGRTRLSWLQRTPTGDNPKQILETLDKIAFLHYHQVNQWTLSQLNPNRINHLAKIGARATNQYLQRATEAKRYPILVAFLKQSLYNFTDDLIEMVDQRIWKLYGEAKRAFEQDRLKATQTINQKLQTLYDIGQILLNPDVEDHKVRTKTFEDISQVKLQIAIGETKQLIRPENDAYVDYFGKYYKRVCHFSRRFLATLQFQACEQDQGLLKALQLVREIHAGTRRKLPDDAPTGFVPEAWRPYVVQPEGIDRRYYELTAFWVLRQNLRSGAVYLTHSRRFSELESYFIPKQEWLLQRDQTVSLLGIPIEPEVRLAEREAELLSFIEAVEALLNEPDGDLREEKGVLVLSPIEAEQRSSQLKQLANTISNRLPQLDITDLLIEVDNWTQFSNRFAHLNGSSYRDDHLLLHLYGCLLAQACNLDLKQMATSAELSYSHLSWCNTWYIRDDTLREANTALINYHYHQPLSQLWGGGMLSSSDGQRFPVKGSVRQGRPLPRYFGYGKGITFYSWTSDQFSQYGSKAVPTTVRDATYVLDEILNNETELPILEHTTDTAGYTELVFALFDLLGLQFSPRIRDLPDQQLYRTSSVNLENYPNLKNHLPNVINFERILQHWDDMLRLAGSLKQGWVSASLIIQKLQAFPRKHPLTRALQEYGRLLKTIHILRWYADETNRRRLNRQINKGEALHSLRSHLCYANQGEIREQQDEQLHNQVGCLNLVTNAVIVWNTVYIEKVIQQLKQEGQFPGDEELKHIWPTRHAHINVYGRYHFDRELLGQKQQLRQLRLPGFQL
ncbi:Tn3 family transposase [Chlorogloeopsis sp. ULAP02]|uniref:Tn3 family transposase n=1 Tax=Chlorogloeopsis sp. ULAP02 TaxID=3107926 RepID=UPI0031357F40